MCNVCDNDIESTYRAVVASNHLVAKAFKLSYTAQLAQTELRLRRYLEAKWNIRRTEAVSKASSMARKKSRAAAITAAINKIMKPWAPEVLPKFNKEMESVYRMARVAGHKKATRQSTASLQYNIPPTTGDDKTVAKAKYDVNPTFDLIDEAAIDALENQNVFWVGQHYDENLSKTIAATAKETMIEAGQSTEKAAKLMEERITNALTIFVTPAGFAGTEKQYFEGLVANAMTVGRTYGQMRSFAQIGIQKYTIVNPGGSRICEVCLGLQGKTFTTEQGLDQIINEFAAKKPETIKLVHPWPRSAKGIAGKTSSQLASAGLALPAYHFRCRCTIDIVDVSSYADLVPMTFPIPLAS